jgi:hypothetical protein
MRLGGWFRLGIVLSVLYGVLVTFVAYEGRPRLEHLESAWFGEAAEVIAEAISKAEGKEVSPYKVREALLKEGGAETTSWLEHVATSPSENQKLFSVAVARVNEKHRSIISTLPDRQSEHWLLAFAWWAGGAFMLFGSGWTVHWVYRGFRRNTT